MSVEEIDIGGKEEAFRFKHQNKLSLIGSCYSSDSIVITGTIPTKHSLLKVLSGFGVGNNSLIGCIPAYVCESMECRTWWEGDWLNGTSSADQECGTLPACGLNETCAR